MITREQYVEILDVCIKYTEMYSKVFHKPMSEDYQHGMQQTLNLIEQLIDNKNV